MTERDSGRERIDFGKRIVAFVGPEGSGKTTMAKRLSSESGKPYLTTGDVLRKLAEIDKGEYGDACREMFVNHTYLNGKLLLEIMCDRFSREDTDNGFILDGGLRSVEETENFQATIEKAGRDLPVTVFYLDIPTEVSFERLVTGKEARKRKDDTIEALESRLEKFHYQLEKRLQIINENPNWEMVRIDAAQPVDNVYRDIYRQLANK